MAISLQEGLAQLGWHLSPDGLQKCQDGCKEKGWKVSTKNIVTIALDMDLRSIGAQSLPVDVARLMNGGVKGPLVLQIQKVKNVAMPSTKQHLPSPNKRMLRLQVTDSQEYISAVESNGAIDKLNPTTPPGTKIRLKGTVAVVNGFLLLTKNSVEVLGGQAESLLKKWNLNKGMSENLSRTRTGGTSGPPPFVPLKDHKNKKGKDTKQSSDQGKSDSLVSKPSELRQAEKEAEKPTRAQMEKPKERLQKKPDRKPEASVVARPPPREKAKSVQDEGPTAGMRGGRRGRGGQREEDDDYQPQSRPKSDYQLADWFGKKLDLNEKATAPSYEESHDALYQQHQGLSSQSTGSSYRLNQRDFDDQEKFHGRQGTSGHQYRDRGASANERYSKGRRNDHSSYTQHYSSSQPLERSDNKSVEKQPFRDKQDTYSDSRRDRNDRHKRDFGTNSQRRDHENPTQRRDQASSTQRRDQASTAQRRDQASSAQRRDQASSAQKRDQASTAQRRDQTSSAQRRDYEKSSRRIDQGNSTQRTGHESTAQKRDHYNAAQRKGKQQDLGSKERTDTHSSRKKEEAPVVREAWAEAGGSWDWVGSSSSAVPFSAKRQN